MTAAVPVVLGHGDAGVGRQELERRGLGGRGQDHRGVRHRALGAQPVDHRRHRGLLLSDRHVEAEHVLPLLVDDGVDRHRRLAGLAVADDQLALATADRDHRVDGLDAGLHGLVDGLARDDAGSLDLDLATLGGVQRPLAVHRNPQRVDHATHQRIAHRHLRDVPGSLDQIALADRLEVAEQGHPDVVLLEVQDQTHDVVAEVQELAGHGLLEAIDARDAVAGLEHRPGLHDRHPLVKSFDLPANDLADFFGADFHVRLSSLPAY
jgi:hypothetical protein